MKPTQGPWRFEDGCIHSETEEVVIAEVYDHNLGPWGEDLPWEANARLMTAAPEMLLILKVFVANGLDAPEFLFARDWAEKTISKIEGDE